MLGTMKDFTAHEDYDDLEDVGIPFSEHEASLLTLHQLEVETLIARCTYEIDASVNAHRQALADKDTIAQLIETYRRQHLDGYRLGLERLQSVLANLTEGAQVGDGLEPFSPEWRDQLRQQVVHDFVQINNEILRRQQKKVDKGELEN